MAIAQDEGRAKNYEFVQKKHGCAQENMILLKKMICQKKSKKRCYFKILEKVLIFCKIHCFLHFYQILSSFFRLEQFLCI